MCHLRHAHRSALRWCAWLAACVLLATGWPSPAAAQGDPAAPSFTLATSHVFSSKEQPAFTLIYRGLDTLDFRVYRVSDPFTFFARLRDPHVLGSPEPIVPQEQTWLERIAAWKSARRGDARGFVRAQFSRQFRQARSANADKEIVQRRTSNTSSFAQVPLLNAAQLVTSWREHLPRVRDAEYRRVPLELPGAGVFVVEAVHAPVRAYTVVIVTDIGLVTKTAPGEMLVFAANRFTGQPAASCQVQLLLDQKVAASGTTATDGVFRAAVTAPEPDAVVTLAQCAGQTAVTDPGAYAIRERARDLVGYTYTDRPVYRPGHIVRYKSVLRWREKGALLRDGLDAVEVAVTDGQSKVLARERKTLDRFGALSGTFTIPASASLGYYSITVSRGDDSAHGSFEVQEYRKPEFDVAVRPATRLELQGRSLTATISARYYFGQPVAGASVKYVLQRQSYYSPLRYSDSDADEDGDGGGYYGGEQTFEGTATLNERGEAQVTVPLALDTEGRDYTARIEARVTDDSDREVSGGASAVATYGRFMVVADTEQYIQRPGAKAVVGLRAIGYDGAPQAGIRMQVRLERWEYRQGRGLEPDATAVATSTATTDAEGRAQWTVDVPRAPGSYRVYAAATSEGRDVTDWASFWVPGGEQEPFEEFSSDRYLELIADRRSYQPGDTARILVRGAEFDNPVLVTKESQHVSTHQVVQGRSGEAIEVPITDADVGDVFVNIAFLRDDRLHRAERRMNVPATSRQLAITATPDRDVIRPGEPGTFTIKATDAAGRPAQAQLSVGLVDEALYGVQPDRTPDPLRFFYRREYNRVNTSFSRDYSFVGYSGTEQLLLARRRRPMTLADFKADRPDRPRVRKEFPDTAFWVADVVTDANGEARVKVDYPDSLTTWRLTVRGVTAATDVGVTTANTLTTKDLILRVVTPRFLTEGDTVTVPTIVHNYLPEPKPVSVSLAAEGLSGDATGGGRSIQVASNGEQRVNWDFTASQVRPVTFTGRATSDAAGDAMEVSLPVLPAGLQRNSGSAGSILDANPRAIDLMVPAAANASGRTVRVSLAPSMAGTILGALDYLTSFPYGCTEQTVSSVVPNLVVLRTLNELRIAPTERLQVLDRQIASGLQRIYDLQHQGAGWGWWKTGDDDPFMTAYAIDGLLQARDNGAQVELFRTVQGARSLAALYAKYPAAIPDLKIFMVHVFARTAAASTYAGLDGLLPVAPALDELWGARGRMTVSGKAFLLMTLDARKDPRADELATEMIGSAQTRGDLSWWTVDGDPFLDDIGDTSPEATALALAALAPRASGNPVLERVARWLVINRSTGGYWYSTKQTAMALKGLLAFMKARGETPAPVTAEVVVNGTRVATRTFDAAALTSPNPVVIEAPAVTGTNSVRITKQGGGTLYYDAAVRYYDRPAATEHSGTRQLALTRAYSVLTPVRVENRIVYREGTFTGTAQPGDLLLVRLTAAGSRDWRYLMLEDPIPAGTEAVTREAAYQLEKPRQWFWGVQRELRDDRAVFFLEDFTDGRYEFSYLLRVTTSGTFGAMPARIAPMYVPDVSASSPAVTLTVPLEAAK